MKRAYARTELLRQMTKFTKSTWDKLIIYKVYIRSILEQSCTVWNSSLTKKNERELERVQKVAVKLIIRNKNTYEENLNELKIQTLKERRNTLSLNFAKNCLLNEKTKNMFIKNKQAHTMKLRKSEKYQIKRTRTERMKNSPLVFMTKQLNQDNEERSRIFKV